MGRQQHLTRLALGRSAFQDVDDEETAQIEREQDTGFHGATSGYVQRYDSKGRPVNPETDVRNAEVRRAFNSVYSIIGVVEKRETLRQASEKRALEEQREERSELLRAEDRCGCDIKSIVAVAEPMAVVWINNLTWRYQLGLYHHRRSFVHQIRATWFLAIQGDWQGANSALFAGAAADQLHRLARIASKKAMALIKDLPISYRSASLLYHENDPYLEVETQPVPSISFEWLLHQAYKARVSLLAWCGWDLVTTKTAGALQTSLGASATGFQALYNNQHSRDPNLDDPNHENLIVLGENHLGPQAAITYRSTTLAQLPVKFLASCVDTMMFRLWTLPLDTLVLRAIAASYIAASLPMTTEAVAAAPRLSSAIQFWRPSTSSNSKSFASYASKIGLGLATQVALDLVLFGGLYGMVRFEGVRKFGWGPVHHAKDNRPSWRP
ncbi:hypothetical protein LTR56_010815 [Elasticomyces elasticus]|nr:hypothetical protein LTR56_010815 [Elasticomyces elasticus]KAK3660916.1 hypothetical protein LTR22_007744 [Elasticomyces elasticus]KAK4932322.1 hypothetical protein LTR49_001191 [Elasticomyces elasticus]KAK5768330.1 hypothetical protein LTS12_001469 [Elasticomyces elasticus]